MTRAQNIEGAGHVSFGQTHDPFSQITHIDVLDGRGAVSGRKYFAAPFAARGPVGENSVRLVGSRDESQT